VPQAVKFAQHLSPPARVYSIVGGISVEEQGFVMHRGVELLVATPGRLVDALESRYLVLAQCLYLVRAAASCCTAARASSSD